MGRFGGVSREGNQAQGRTRLWGRQDPDIAILSPLVGDDFQPPGCVQERWSAAEPLTTELLTGLFTAVSRGVALAATVARAVRGDRET